tara:strand:- start:411 stop:995 length:585 start_codon:yes stop_codon:yes gene_type:complete
MLKEWRAYLREAKKPATYHAGTIQCPAGATGAAGYVKTPKGRKLVKFCPSESEAKADAGMKLHKKGIEQALLKIKNSKEALAYLRDVIDEDIYGDYIFLLSNTPESIIGEFDPFDADAIFAKDFAMDVITKENYNKEFDSIIKRVYSLFDPFYKGMGAKLQKDINMQNKLGDLYENALKLFNHVKEYHKARIAY